jgi:hypothetical protein
MVFNIWIWIIFFKFVLLLGFFLLSVFRLWWFNFSATAGLDWQLKVYPLIYSSFYQNKISPFHSTWFFFLLNPTLLKFYMREKWNILFFFIIFDCSPFSFLIKEDTCPQKRGKFSIIFGMLYLKVICKSASMTSNTHIQNDACW